MHGLRMERGLTGFDGAVVVEGDPAAATVVPAEVGDRWGLGAVIRHGGLPLRLGSLQEQPQPRCRRSAPHTCCGPGHSQRADRGRVNGHRMAYCTLHTACRTHHTSHRTLHKQIAPVHNTPECTTRRTQRAHGMWLRTEEDGGGGNIPGPHSVVAWRHRDHAAHVCHVGRRAMWGRAQQERWRSKKVGDRQRTPLACLHTPLAYLHRCAHPAAR